MMKLTLPLLLTAVITTGCAPDISPPETFSIDPDFSPGVAETLRAVVDGWCEAVGWCPKETDDPELPGRFVHTEVTGHDLDFGVSAAYNRYRWSIVIADGYWNEDLSLLWTLVAHEVGHYCTVEGRGGVDATQHTDDGLMSAFQAEPRPEIDAKAIRAWKVGCVN